MSKQKSNPTKSNKKRRVLFVTSTFPSSDTDPVPAFVRDEAIWLNKVYGYQVDILAPHNSYSETISYQKCSNYDEYRFHYFFPFKYELLAGRGIEPALRKNKFLFAQLPFFFIFEFISLLKLAHKKKPDIVYAHWFTPQAITAFAVSKILKIPFVFDTQASDIIVLKKIPFSKKIVSLVCNNALSYTAPSNMTAEKLEYFTRPDNHSQIMNKLSIIPMGTKVEKPDPKVISKLMREVNPENKKIILFMGRLVDRKGVDDLIKAFSSIESKYKNCILLIAGDGQESGNLQNLVNRLLLKDKVKFLGYVTGEMKTNLLFMTDIYVLPSINVGDQAEGLPIAFMEAVSAGNITVISDATGAHEVVANNKNSLVFKAGSVRDLEKKLAVVLDMNDRDISAFKKNVLNFSRIFQWESIIRKRHDALNLGPKK